MNDDLIFSVSDFVAVCNQTLEFAYPSVVIEGELANLRISKNRWVYCDVKDDMASVRFFGTVHMLPGPLENGMMVRVRGTPRLHPQYGFSITMQHIQAVGEGTIRRAAELLQAKLAAEGLFDEARKRHIPYPPERIGLITSAESAAYADFMKILNARWSGVEVMLADVQVQGEPAPEQIIAAINQFNMLSDPPEVLVLTRGGGSAEDLQAFSDERVTRAVAASRIPTLVAIGHEIDVSLAELAADRRASTPSNAAELLTPDRRMLLTALTDVRQQLQYHIDGHLSQASQRLELRREQLRSYAERSFREARLQLTATSKLLDALNPRTVLSRGYAIVRVDGQGVYDAAQLSPDAIVDIEFRDGHRQARIEKGDKE
jgi:exodeoxyribonuclease VII large subunit